MFVRRTTLTNYGLELSLSLANGAVLSTPKNVWRVVLGLRRIISLFLCHRTGGASVWFEMFSAMDGERKIPSLLSVPRIATLLGSILVALCTGTNYVCATVICRPLGVLTFADIL